MRLLYLSQDDIEKLVKGYEEEVTIIKRNALKAAWYMRGSLSYVDAMNLSPTETNIINKLIDENLEVTKKSGLPFF
jgi:hypothetical protein